MKDNPCWYPLRKVVGQKGFDDILECGHSLFQASDMYGPRFPGKRRCRHCWKALTEEQRASVRKNAQERKEARQRKEWAEWEAWKNKK